MEVKRFHLDEITNCFVEKKSKSSKSENISSEQEWIDSGINLTGTSSKENEASISKIPETFFGSSDGTKEMIVDKTTECTENKEISENTNCSVEKMSKSSNSENISSEQEWIDSGINLAGTSSEENKASISKILETIYGSSDGTKEMIVVKSTECTDEEISGNIIVTSPEATVTDLNEEQVVYLMTCGDCKREYIGQTINSLNETISDIKSKVNRGGRNRKDRKVISHFIGRKCNINKASFITLNKETNTDKRNEIKRQRIVQYKTKTTGLNVLSPRKRIEGLISKNKITKYYPVAKTVCTKK